MASRKRDWSQQERDRNPHVKVRRFSQEIHERGQTQQPQVRERRDHHPQMNDLARSAFTVETLIQIKADQPPRSPSAMTEPLVLPDDFESKNLEKEKVLCTYDQMKENVSTGIDYYKKYPEKLAEEEAASQSKIQSIEATVKTLYGEYDKAVSLNTSCEERIKKLKCNLEVVQQKFAQLDAKFAEMQPTLLLEETDYADRYQRQTQFTEKRLLMEKEYYEKKSGRVDYVLRKIRRNTRATEGNDEPLKQMDEEIARLKADCIAARDHEVKYEGVVREAKAKLEVLRATYNETRTARDKEKASVESLEKLLAALVKEHEKSQDALKEMQSRLSAVRLEEVEVQKRLIFYYFIKQNELLDKKAETIQTNPFVGLREESKLMAAEAIKAPPDQGAVGTQNEK